MLDLILASAPLASDIAGGMLDPFSGIYGLFIGVYVFMIVLGIVSWIYTSLAYMAIAKKNNQSAPGISWIPFIGPFIVAYRASKMHWWPWLMLISLLFLGIPLLGILLAFIPLMIFSVFTLIWNWKMFEAIGKPGWWALVVFIPLVGPIAFFVVLGMAAWGQ